MQSVRNWCRGFESGRTDMHVADRTSGTARQGRLCTLQSSGVPRNFFGGGSTNSVEDRENRDLGVVVP